MFGKKKTDAEKEEMLKRNDPGAEAVKRQQEATADIAQADGVKEQPEEKNPLFNETDDNVVNDVINGKYGTGNARKKALMEAGYDPDDVQSKVNNKLNTTLNIW